MVLKYSRRSSTTSSGASPSEMDVKFRMSENRMVMGRRLLAMTWPLLSWG
jgi:hypothetical protein